MEMERTVPSLLMRLDAVDARLLAWVASRRHPHLVAAMRAVTRTGDASVVALALLLALFAWPGRVTALAAGATVVGLGLFLVAKRLCNRPRPASVHMVLAAPDRFSLPSGHATCAWAIAVSVATLVPALAAPLVTWAALVTASRVVLGVHYPFDVLAGSLLGSGAAAAALALVGA